MVLHGVPIEIGHSEYIIGAASATLLYESDYPFAALSESAGKHGRHCAGTRRACVGTTRCGRGPGSSPPASCTSSWASSRASTVTGTGSTGTAATSAPRRSAARHSREVVCGTISYLRQHIHSQRPCLSHLGTEEAAPLCLVDQVLSTLETYEEAFFTGKHVDDGSHVRLYLTASAARFTIIKYFCAPTRASCARPRVSSEGRRYGACRSTSSSRSPSARPSTSTCLAPAKPWAC